jgi:hypothetical protein
VSGQNGPKREFALYHPWPPIDGRLLGEWVKTMLLFFEGIAIMAPPEAGANLISREESTFGPLADQGLFRLLDPADLIQVKQAEAILEFLFSLAADVDEGRPWGWWGLEKSLTFRWSSSDLRLAMERGGLIFAGRSLHIYNEGAVRRTATMIWDVLERHGLATTPDSEGSFYMHPDIWVTYEAFLAHAVADSCLREGLLLRPATDDAFQSSARDVVLNMPGYPSAGNVVGFDLQQVALDVSPFGLDEVLQFRNEQGADYRRYARNLRKFAVEASQVQGQEREMLLRERHEELADAADDLRRSSRDWWRRASASVGIGISGAVCSATTGEWPAAIVSLLGGIAGAGARPKPDSAFTYLFKAEQTFSR